MNCKFCGAALAENSNFCSSCGQPVGSAAKRADDGQGGYYQQSESNAYMHGNPNNYGNPTPNANGRNANYDYSYEFCERVLSSDADSARILGIIGIVCAFFLRIAGLVLGIISIMKANKCLRVRDDEYFRSAKKFGVAAVALNIVFMVLSVVIPIVFLIVNAQLILEILDEVGLDWLASSFYHYY